MSSRSSFTGLAATGAALALVICLSAPTAGAGEPGERAARKSDDATAVQRPARKGRRHAPRRDYTRETQVQRTENGHTSQTVFTGENGRTVTRDAVVTNDREAGTRTRDVTWTGPNGGQGTVDDVMQRTDDGYTRQTTVIGPKGGTAARDVTVACDKDARSCSKTVDVNREPPADSPDSN